MRTMTFRLVKPEDAKEILDIYGPFIRDTNVSFEYDIPSLEDFRKRIIGISSYYPYIVCELEGRLVGYAYATRFRERKAYCYDAETSIYINPDLHGRKIGSELYKKLIAMMRLQGLYNAYAGVALPNEQSLGLHRSLGYTDIGIYKNVGYKFGKWLDAAWLVKPLQSFEKAPGEVIPIPEVDKQEVRKILENTIE